MATINLGRVKPVFRGAYNNSTAYVVDDIVTSSDETFICIAASTGNATSNATYWTKLAAKGTNGTDGTDLTTTLTTQGDIVYRDASGLARLPAGSANQVLQTGGAGANPSWTTMSSDVVLVSETASTSGTVVQFTDIFSSTYKYYHVKFGFYHASSGFGAPRIRFLSSGTTQLSATSYSSSSIDWGHAHGNTASNYGPSQRGYHEDYGRLHPDQVGVASGRRSFFDLWFYEPTNASTSPVMKFTHSGYSDNTWIEPGFGNVIYNTGGTAHTGFQMQDTNGVNIYITNFKCYGFK